MRGIKLTIINILYNRAISPRKKRDDKCFSLFVPPQCKAGKYSLKCKAGEKEIAAKALIAIEGAKMNIAKIINSKYRKGRNVIEAEVSRVFSRLRRRAFSRGNAIAFVEICSPA